MGNRVLVSACQHRFPNTQPETVAMAMTKTTKTTVFLKPSTWLMTSMLGSDKDGPAKSNANAGPLPMPEANRPCMIGTSVSVAKYMKAPVKLARKLDNREFPPTAHCIHSLDNAGKGGVVMGGPQQKTCGDYTDCKQWHDLFGKAPG